MKLVKIIIVIIIILTLAALAQGKILHKNGPQSGPNPSPSQEDKPKILSTKPSPLQDATIPAVDSLEITFNKPLEAPSEFKVRIEPKLDFTIELSADKTTGKIIFKKPLELGLAYALYIGRDTKFVGLGPWGEDKEFHFRTIDFKGI